MATGAIPQGALVAEELNLPFVYVRSTPKDHEMCIRDRYNTGTDYTDVHGSETCEICVIRACKGP